VTHRTVWWHNYFEFATREEADAFMDGIRVGSGEDVAATASPRPGTTAWVVVTCDPNDPYDPREHPQHVRAEQDALAKLLVTGLWSNCLPPQETE
jgi:hypothetical protein